MTITITTLVIIDKQQVTLAVSKILDAIKLKIHEIVLKEQRPFWLADQEFEIGGENIKFNTQQSHRYWLIGDLLYFKLFLRL
jgi:hypothetical protein